MPSAGSKGSGSEDEPLVPDDIDDEFLAALIAKVPEISKALRQKDTHENADNVQRLLICLNRYKSDYHLEQLRTEELNNEISRLNDRLENAAELSRLDQEAIAELRSVIEGAWKQKDAAQNREQIAQDEVMKLREKIDMLEESVQRLSDKSLVMQTKREENKVQVKLNMEIKELNKRLQIQRAYTTDVEAMTKTLEEKNKALIKVLDETSTEAYNNKKRIDILQKELATMKTDELKYTEQISHIQAANDHLTKVKVRQNLQILSLKTNLEHLNSQNNATCNKLAKLTIDMEYLVQERDAKKRDLMQKANLLKAREDEIIKLKQENCKLAKSHESIDRKYGALDDDKRAAEAENIRLKTQRNTQDKEVESMRRLVHQFEKNNHNLTKERDVLKRQVLQEQRKSAETTELFQKSQHEIHSLMDTINNLELKMKKLRDDFNKLSKSKEKKLEEIQMMADKMETLQNEIHLKENYTIELKRTINDIEVKCAKLQTQQDVFINERNSLQRNLQATDEEKSKLKQNMTTLENDIEKLKDRLAYRSADNSKLQLQLDRMEKERRMIRNEARSAKLAHQHTRAELLEKKKENDRSSKSLQEDELNMSRLKKELDVIINEKNTVSAQLKKRNDEYAQLKDKYDNLQSAFDQTEKRFAQCQDDMRLMSVEIKNLRTERNVLRKDRESAADLRQELLQMHRLLNQERIKARAFQEEMMTPMNVHRWRNLSGRDPEKMDLINRLQALRKQLLSQNVAALEQERALEESHYLYTALKEFMMKLPSYKIKEELNHVKARISGKDKKLKALIAELHTKEADDKTKDIKLEEFKSQLAAARTQLTQEKKKKQKLLEERQIFAQMQTQCYSAPPSMQRTFGGGFKMMTGGGGGSGFFS